MARKLQSFWNRNRLKYGLVPYRKAVDLLEQPFLQLVKYHSN